MYGNAYRVILVTKSLSSWDVKLVSTCVHACGGAIGDGDVGDVGFGGCV